ncbi:unnamed protein product [Hyaloperonospora brassicae]|uniref:FYVE-type domain-containing protein n=1 Tax=Hyaloperonospora brassicae TaxID=162125 RepID=A0AAV0T1W8_HYABA|nr:unnamed protein product [Hyaloperonospora brassicae]
MTSALPFPLYAGFFPQLVLTVEELMQYRRSSKAAVAHLARISDDADCVYRWTDVKALNGRNVQRAQCIEMTPTGVPSTGHVPEPSARTVSTLLKCSVHLVDVQVDEILQAVATVKTRDARRAMHFLHREDVGQVDTRTLLTFPTSLKHRTPSFAYRAIKWRLLTAKQREGHKKSGVDFCYLEYAGKKKTASAQGVVGFCIQESIAKERQVPTLERYNVERKQVARSGLLITRTHQSNILKVTAIAQIDRSATGATATAAASGTTTEIMVDFVAAVHRVKGLLERQRIGRLQYLDEWEWISSKDRKACAVCLQRFYFHRKQHCVTCGEVVCSTCAPLRELEQPLDEQTHTVRVCSVCMAQAGSHRESSLLGGVSDIDDGLIETASATTNVGTESYVEGLRYSKHPGIPRCSLGDPGRLSQTTSVRSSFRRRQQHPLSSRSSTRASATYEHDEGSHSEYYARAASEYMGSMRQSSGRRRSTLLSAPLSARAKKEALSKLVEHARHIRDTIDMAISEAEGDNERPSEWLERSYGRSDVDDEQYDEIYDRIMKIRETLDASGSDLDAVLSSIGLNDPIRPSDADSNQCDSDLVFSFSEPTGSEHPDTIESVRSRSSCSSLSASVQSLDHQDAGEPLPSPTPEQESAIEEARALEEAMQWVRQSEPSANLRMPRIAPANEVGIQAEPELSSRSAALPTSVGSAVSNRGIERLAQKIGRLNERIEATQQREHDAINTGPTSTGARALATPALLGEPVVVDERRGHTSNEEVGADERSMRHRSARSSTSKSSRGRVPRASSTKQMAHVTGAALSSSSVVSRGSSAHGSLLSDHDPSDLVASLRGVMNSSELSHAPSRRRSRIASVTLSPSPVEVSTTYTPSTLTPSRQTYPGTPRRPPPPPPPATLPALHPCHLTRQAAMPPTAPMPMQSTAFCAFDPDDGFQTVHQHRLDDGPPDGTEAEPVTAMARDQDIDDEHGAHGKDSLVFASHEEQRQGPRPAAAIALPPASSTNRRESARDESRELRELMEGLAKAPLRSRCSSGQSSGAPPTEKFDI